MRTKITGRHMELTEAMRAYTEKKIARLSKYNNRVSEIEVIHDCEGQLKKVEIILKVDNHQPFVVNHSDEDAYACLDSAVDKIERQLTKHKEKTRIHKGRTSAAEATAEIIESQSSPAEEK